MFCSSEDNYLNELKCRVGVKPCHTRTQQIITEIYFNLQYVSLKLFNEERLDVKDVKVSSLSTATHRRAKQ